MPNDNFIREQCLEIEINAADAKISKLPTDTIRALKEALTAHYSKAVITGEYKKEIEEMLRKYETYILQDSIQLQNDLEAAVRCSKMIGESLI